MMLTHTIKKGDSLWDLARHITGDGRNWKQIAEINGINDPKRIRVGTKVFIPANLHTRANREFERMDRQMGYRIDPGSHVYNLKSYGQQRNSGFLAEPVDRPEYGKSMGRLEGPKNRPEYGRSIGRLEEPRERALEAMVLRMLGRGGDTEIGHLTEGEIVVPRGAQGGGLRDIIRGALKAKGYDFERYEVGGGGDSRNPMTGAPEFYDSELTDVYDPGFIAAAGGSADQTGAMESVTAGTGWDTPTGLQSTAGMLPSGEYMPGYGPQGQIAQAGAFDQVNAPVTNVLDLQNNPTAPFQGIVGPSVFDQLAPVTNPLDLQNNPTAEFQGVVGQPSIFDPLLSESSINDPFAPVNATTPILSPTAPWEGLDIVDSPTLQESRQLSRPQAEPVSAERIAAQTSMADSRARDAVAMRGGTITPAGIQFPDWYGRLRDTGVQLSELEGHQAPALRAAALAEAVNAGVLGWGFGNPNPAAGLAASQGLEASRQLSPLEVQISNALGNAVSKIGLPVVGNPLSKIANIEGNIKNGMNPLAAIALEGGKIAAGQAFPGAGMLAGLALGARGEGSMGDKISNALTSFYSSPPYGFPDNYAANPANYYSGPGNFIGQGSGEQSGPVGNQFSPIAFDTPQAQQAAALSALVPALRNATPPSILGFDEGLSDLQRRAQIATYGTQGQDSRFRDVATQQYYKDLLTNAINQAGLGAILPVEWQYLAQVMGIPQMSTQQALLEAIASA